MISVTTSPKPSTLYLSSETTFAGSTSSIQSKSSGVTTRPQTTAIILTSASPPSILSNSSFSTSSPSTKPATSDRPSSQSMTSHIHTSSTKSTSSKTSTSSSTGSNSSTTISRTASSNPTTKRSSPSSQSPISYSTCATCSYPTPTIACTAINSYRQYHSGQCHVENPDNPGNIDPLYPPIYTYVPDDPFSSTLSYSNSPVNLDHYRTYTGALNACDAASACAHRSKGFDPDVYTSFDLHYLCSNSSWVCVQYYGANFRGSYFDVQEFDAVVSYGYYSFEDHGSIPVP